MLKYNFNIVNKEIKKKYVYTIEYLSPFHLIKY